MDDSENTSQMLPINSATPQNANLHLFHHFPGSQTQDSGIWETLEAEKRNCVVCGEANSKKYYGQYTCEACKVFFQRTVKGNLLYECRCNGQCSVDVKTRHKCQYCRFQKCLQVGIRAETASKQTRPRFFPFAPSGDERAPNSSETCETFKFLPADILSALKSCETLLGISMSRTCIVENYVNWARNMPFFDSLNVVDQQNLLVDAFSDVLLLRISHFLYRGTNIFQNPQITDEKFHQHRKLLRVYDLIYHLELTYNEYLLLKAILLFGEGRSGLFHADVLPIIEEAFYPYPIIPSKLAIAQVEYFNCLRSYQNYPDVKPVDLILFRWTGLKAWKFRETLLDFLSLKECTLRMEIQRILIKHLIVWHSQKISTLNSTDERRKNGIPSSLENSEVMHWQNIYYRTIGKYVLPQNATNT